MDSLHKNYVVSSVNGRRLDFQKADRQGENPFAKGFSPWTPFPKTPKWLRSRHEPTTGSLTRTRPEEAYLGVLCGGAGGRLSCKKEPPGLPAEQKEQSICKKCLPGSSTSNSWFLGIDLALEVARPSSSTRSAKRLVSVRATMRPLRFMRNGRNKTRRLSWMG